MYSKYKHIYKEVSKPDTFTYLSIHTAGVVVIKCYTGRQQTNLTKETQTGDQQLHIYLGITYALDLVYKKHYLLAASEQLTNLLHHLTPVNPLAIFRKGV